MRNEELTWAYMDEPDPTRNGRRTFYFGGRVLGGGSSINGMVWVRGHRRDFDRWAELGCHGWDYENVLPYFKRAETFRRGDPAFRGTGGPQTVSRVEAPHVVTDAFVAAADKAGHAFVDDYNGEKQEGVSYGQASTRRGFRNSTARAYLAPVRRRPNLTVMVNTLVEKIVFEGTTATGVEIRRRHGSLARIHATREVILSAGALSSPKVLMLSGVGPGEVLGRHGIPVVRDLAGVGSNFQEHPVVHLVYNVDTPTFNMEFTLKDMARHGARFLLEGRGPASSSFFNALLFARLSPTASWPEIEAGFSPFALHNSVQDRSSRSRAADHDVRNLAMSDLPAATVFLTLLHPRSRGRLGLQSNNPADLPVIEHAMFSDREDLDVLMKAVPVIREIFATSPLAEHVISELRPGAQVKSDDELEAYLRSSSSGAFHACGTCKMGVDDESVVDPRLRVQGIGHLRVADASVIPEITSGNTNAPVIMIAEKAADLILED
jgi:choline dehydrogenase